MTIAAVLALLGRLFKAYALDAWPFAILHCLVAVFLLRSILKVVRQTGELRAWEPATTTVAGPTAVLSSFIRDSESLGRRGFVVPITDYSDRLDSEVENLIDEVADRMNMLLLVGIAGTLFGIFEFASRATTLGGDRLTQIGSLLGESMAKAFPVAFIGLMLMLAFQLFLAGPVSAFHRAASEATRRALEHRGVVSLTLAEAIGESIAESMKPVSTLGTTVSEHLQPVVAALGERLEQSLSLVKLQFGEIDESTQRFIKATSSLQQSSNALTNSSARLEELLRTAPKVLAKTEKIQELHDAAMQEIAAAFRRNIETAGVAAETLKSVQDGLSTFPERFAEQAALAIAPAFERVAIESSATWHDLVKIVAVDIQRDYAEFAASSRHEVALVNEGMHAASEEMRRLAEGAQASLSEPLKTAIETARQEASAALAEVDAFVRTRYPALRDDMEAFRATMTSIVETLGALDRSLKSTVERTSPAPQPQARNDRDGVEVALAEILAELRKRGVTDTPEEQLSLWERILGLLGLH